MSYVITQKEIKKVSLKYKISPEILYEQFKRHPLHKIELNGNVYYKYNSIPTYEMLQLLLFNSIGMNDLKVLEKDIKLGKDDLEYFNLTKLYLEDTNKRSISLAIRELLDVNIKCIKINDEQEYIVSARDLVKIHKKLYNNKGNFIKKLNNIIDLLLSLNKDLDRSKIEIFIKKILFNLDSY